MGTKSSTDALRLLAVIGVSLNLGACSYFSKKPTETPEEPVIKTETLDTVLQNKHDPIANGDAVPVDASMLAANPPRTHVVVKGDTLWDISGMFLKSPWLWPQIWEFNPGIENPHLIYPGDIIALEYYDGQPHLIMNRERLTAGAGSGAVLAATRAGYSSSGQTTRLSPRIRSESLEDAIPVIPGDAISQFLDYPRVVEAKELEAAPYVIGNYEGRLASATGHQIYARGNIHANRSSYGIFRNNKPLYDPDTRELLGFEVSHVGNAKLMQYGDPSTLVITSNNAETLAGDRLLATHEQQFVHNYVPRIPELEREGRIISLIDALTRSGRNQVVVLNLGKNAGMQVGDVLAIERRGGSMVDRFSRSGLEEVDLPSTRTGVVMVFQTFEKVSYALVMESIRPIRMGDIATNI